MARICGIDLDKNEARIVVLDGTLNAFEIVDIPINRIGLIDPKSQDEVRSLGEKLQSFFDEMAIDSIGIRERLSKGRMKGGTITFKIEGLIQSCRQQVVLISPATIRSVVTKANIEMSELPISTFQYEAYGAAFCLLSSG